MKVRTGVLLSLYAAVCFFSCAEPPKDRRPPKITVISGGTARRDASFETGDSVKIYLRVESPSTDFNLKQLFIQLNYDSLPTRYSEKVNLEGLNAAVFRFDTFAGSRARSEEWIFTLETINGGILRDTIRYSVRPKESETVFRSFSLPMNADFAFASTLSGLSYKPDEAKLRPDSIDVAYFFETNTGIEFVSPVLLKDSIKFQNKSQNWTVRTNSWRTTDLTETQFNDLSYTDSSAIINLFKIGQETTPDGTILSQKNTVKPITEKSVWAFFNGRKYGLMLIKNIPAQPADRINLSFKVLK